MTFNSFTYFAFLGVVLILHRLLPWRFGRIVLVAASYIFYGAANPWYCLLLLASTLTDYAVGIGIEQTEEQPRRRRLLAASVGVNLGLLGLFKYGDFLIGNVNTFLPPFSQFRVPSMDLVLPIGISFYTFQTLSYSIDVYRKRTPACRNFWNFSLFVAFFPQLVAGPIERAARLIPQLATKQRVSDIQFSLGLQRILWGVVKKTVIADRLAVLVNDVYAAPSQFSSPVVLLTIVGFMFQLYLDFSAYCDIAIGSAQLMGVRLSENFDHPLASRNPADFWSRWHMTLTRWFTDYVFRPMGGLKLKSPLRSGFNTIVVFGLIGLWHGAAWHFLFFGLVSGVLTAGYFSMRMYVRRQSKGPILGERGWSWPLALTMNAVFICGTGIFFRSPDLHTVVEMIHSAFLNGWSVPQFLLPYIVLVGMLYAVHVSARFVPIRDQSGRLRISIDPLLVNFILLLVIIYGAYDYSETFIYFEF